MLEPFFVRKTKGMILLRDVDLPAGFSDEDMDIFGEQI
jgi:hypothetical protein